MTQLVAPVRQRQLRYLFMKLLKLDGLWCPSVDVDVFITSTAYCDPDLWSPKSNHVISRCQQMFPVSFVEILKPFMRNHGNKISPDKQTDERSGRQPKT